MPHTTIVLKSGKDQSVRRFHPWLFSGAIKKITGPVAEGDLVRVTDNKGEFLGHGHYQIGSIAVRIFSFSDEVPVDSIWQQKIAKSWSKRKEMRLAGNPSTNVFRLINAEGDGMPGLIIDYYNGCAVMQMHSIGMYRNREKIAGALEEVIGKELHAIYDKSSATIPYKSGIQAEDEYLMGSATDGIVTENDLKFKVDWETGQKTGFFIDQRENRKLLLEYAEGKRVLNMFGYTGGFSVYALQGRAQQVVTVDASRKAMELTEVNVGLNFGEDKRHLSVVTDAFEYLDKMDDSNQLIILDPPAFAKHGNVLHNALQGYKRLNAKAMEKLAPNGVLFTFSCSQVVSRENFRKSVFVAAANSGRTVQILHQLTQPPDHPVSIYHPEGEYLKGLVLRVE
jgi:23S rRNA (cytosine1962-C5)-methyltransferase